MSALEVRGLEETSARFDAYPAALQAALGRRLPHVAAGRAVAGVPAQAVLLREVITTASGGAPAEACAAPRLSAPASPTKAQDLVPDVVMRW